MPRLRPPANHPLQSSAGQQPTTAWAAYFQGLGDATNALQDQADATDTAATALTARVAALESVAATIAGLHATVSHANDAAAAAAGVNVGELYRNGSVLMTRIV
jgi:hypothetical protein